MDAFYRGELKVGLKYLPSGGSKSQGTLVIDIKQAKDLPAVASGATNQSVVKIYLLPNRKSKGKRKTGVFKNSLNPLWEEKFTYEDVNITELSSERALEVSVWNYDDSSHTFIGGLRLGPAPGTAAKHKDWMDSIGEEVTHWEDMLAHPGEWVEKWHTLRPTLNPRDIDLQAPAPAEYPTSTHLSPIYAEETQESLMELVSTYSDTCERLIFAGNVIRHLPTAHVRGTVWEAMVDSIKLCSSSAWSIY